MTANQHNLPLLAALTALLTAGPGFAQDDPLDDLPEPPAQNTIASEPTPPPSDQADTLDDPPEDLGDLPEAPAPVEESAIAPPTEEDAIAPSAEADPLEDLPEAGDELADVPELMPPPGGGLLEIEFTGDIAEMRLKGPDGKYYTPGRLHAGRYVLGIRYAEKEDWVRFTFELAEGRETRIDCDVAIRECGVKSRVWTIK